MVSLEKWKILTPLQNLPENVGDLGQLVVAKGFEKLPKVQKIAKSGHTAPDKLSLNGVDKSYQTSETPEVIN